MYDKKDLDHRFWLHSELPDGVKPRYFGHLKTREFLKVYSKSVSPHLRKAGFRCRGARAARERPAPPSLGDGMTLWDVVFFSGGKAGGYIWVSYGTHVSGLPDINDKPFEPDSAAPYLCRFARDLELYPGQGQFDVGWDADEAGQTCKYINGCLDQQALPFFDATADGVEALLEVNPGSFSDQMPRLLTRHCLRPENDALGLWIPSRAAKQDARFEGNRFNYVLVLCQLNHLAGRRETALAFCDLAEELTREDERGELVPFQRKRRARLLSKLRAEPADLFWTSEDQAACW
jgi:hypothetical protein